MIAIIRELFHHQAHADASFLMAIQRYEMASKDRDVLSLIHDILIAHRFWVYLCQDLPFPVEAADTAPGTLDEIAALFPATQAREPAWMYQLEEVDLERIVESPYIPGREVNIGECLMQACLHSQWHRVPLAVRLRALRGEPPAIDYIFWIEDRPFPSWP
jgi:hypothetical protein